MRLILVADALSTTCGLPRESILPSLPALALACCVRHQIDERGDDDDDDADDANDADVEADHVDGE